MHLDDRLDTFGYRKIDETSVQLLDLAIPQNNADPHTKAKEKLTQEWLDGYAQITHITDEATQQTLKSTLGNIIGKTLWAAHRVDNHIVGVGRAVIDREYAGIFDIHVHESYRGNGYGKSIMYKLLAEAKALGAKQAYLQVVVGNKVAENLYAKLGFAESYRYWYRVR